MHACRRICGNKFNCQHEQLDLPEVKMPSSYDFVLKKHG